MREILTPFFSGRAWPGLASAWPGLAWPQRSGLASRGHKRAEESSQILAVVVTAAIEDDSDPISRRVREILTPFGEVRMHSAPQSGVRSGVVWGDLVASGVIWDHVGSFGVIWHHLVVSGVSWSDVG